jgi:uroporphyrinogen III methyltransferase/synthase
LVEKESKPLEGRTIVITRPRSQSAEMTRLIEEMGGSTLFCPTIEVIEPRNWNAVDTAIENLESYDWVIFTSANGPRFFFHRLAEKRSDWRNAIGKAVIFAIGSATANSVEAYGLRVDIVATESRAEGAVQAIIEKVGGKHKISGLRFLIPRAKVAREVLPVELTRLGASVDAVEVYETIKPQIDLASIIDLFKEKKVDAITFTSPSTVSNFAALVGFDDLSDLLSETIVGCIGPTTTARATQFKLTDIVQPDEYNAQALVEAIAKAISEQ